MKSLKETHLIVETAWNKLQYFGNHYLWPSQVTWIRWLKDSMGWEFSRRTLNRWFAAAEENGYIMRIRRGKKDPEKGYIFQTTLYALTLRGLKYLLKRGIITWGQLRAYLKGAQPFRARVPKRKRKGANPIELDPYSNFTHLGSIVNTFIG